MLRKIDNFYFLLTQDCVTDGANVTILQSVPKNDPTCFCQNFIKSQENLIIFGLQIAKAIEKCKADLLSTSRSLCQRTTV